MYTILDYLSWRGDLSLAIRPFNEVDNLILSELAYADFRGIVPPPASGESISLRDAVSAYFADGREQSYLICDPRRLLEAAWESVRFSELRLSGYVDEIDREKQTQFAAMCFHLGDGSSYVAYRGTDDSLVGWREDFNLSFLDETYGQQRAVRYLEQVSAESTGPLRVGGHSKGGNLAVYAAAFCSPQVKERIQEVYSNDGPGFRKAVTDSEEYRQSMSKLRIIVPESSLVGILLFNKGERKIIKSASAGIQQHDPYSWEVLGEHFVEAEKLSPASALADEALDRWTDALDDEQRANLVSAIFDALEATGAETLTQLSSQRWATCNAVLKAIRDLEPQRQKEVRESVKKLRVAGKEALWMEARRSLEAFLREHAHRGRGEERRD